MFKNIFKYSSLIFISLVKMVACSDDDGSGGVGHATTPIDQNCQFATPAANGQWTYNNQTIHCNGLNNAFNHFGNGFQNFVYDPRNCSEYAIRVGGAFTCVGASFLIQIGIEPNPGVLYYNYVPQAYFNNNAYYYYGGFGFHGYGSDHNNDQFFCALGGGLAGASAGGLINGGEGALIGGLGGALIGAIACD